MSTFVLHPVFLAFGSKEKTATMTRTRLVTIRLSDAEYTHLATAAKAAQTSVSAVLRDRACASSDPSLLAPAALASPPAGPLTSKVSSRLTPAEAEKLTERARECNLPIAAYVRQVLRSISPSAHRPQAHAALVALSRVGNNLNQLTRLAHGGTLMSRDLFGAIEALRAEVNQLREDILAALEGRP
jgi:mobilization protein NikA